MLTPDQKALVGANRDRRVFGRGQLTAVAPWLGRTAKAVWPRAHVQGCRESLAELETRGEHPVPGSLDLQSVPKGPQRLVDSGGEGTYASPHHGP